jgi:DnaA family protein
MQQIPLAIAPVPLATFETTVPGANTAALAHLRQLAPGAPPVYLWGPAGSGKTHLLQALAHGFQAQGARVGWFEASAPLPWTLQPGWALVVLDDVHQLPPAAQHAAFALFVEAQAAGLPWAAAGSLPPVDLPLRDDLRTRLAWGHVFALQPLTEAETRAALRREADRRSFFFSDEVMDHLLTRFPRDLKTLMALLERLDGYSLARGRRVTVPLLREMLAEPDMTMETPAAPARSLDPA